MATTTITRNTRNISFGATNSVHRVPTANGNGYLAVDSVSRDIAGRATTPRGALAQYHDARRRNSGNYWSGAFFVAGRRAAGELRDVVADLTDLVAGRVDTLTLEVL